MMQLILETEPSGDIRTNMSLEVETPTNGDINELKSDLLSNKENTLKNDNIISNSVKDVTVIMETEVRHDLSSNLNADCIESEDMLLENTIEEIHDKIVENGVNEEKEIEDVLNIPIIEAMDIDEVSDILSNDISPSNGNSEYERIKSTRIDQQVENSHISFIPQNLEQVKLNDLVLNKTQDLTVIDNEELKNNVNLILHSEENSTNGIGLSYTSKNMDVEVTNTDKILENIEKVLASSDDINKGEMHNELETSTNKPCTENKFIEDKVITCDVSHLMDDISNVSQDIIKDETNTTLSNTEESYTIDEEDLKNKFIEIVDTVPSKEFDVDTDKNDISQDSVENITKTDVSHTEESCTNDEEDLNNKANKIADNVSCKEFSIDADKSLVTCKENVVITQPEFITLNEVPCVETINQPLVLSEEPDDVVTEQENIPTDTIKSVHKVENSTVGSDKLLSMVLEKDTVIYSEYKDVASVSAEEVIHENLAEDGVHNEIKVSVKNNSLESNEVIISDNKLSEDNTVDIQKNSVILTENLNSSVNDKSNGVLEILSETNHAGHTIKDNITSAGRQEKFIDVDMNADIDEVKGSKEMITDITSKEKEIVEVNNTSMDIDLSDEVNMSINENISKNDKNSLIDVSNEKKTTSENESSPKIICDDKHDNECVDLDQEDNINEVPLNNISEILNVNNTKKIEMESNDNIEVIDEDDIKIIEDDHPKKTEDRDKAKIVAQKPTRVLPVVCKLSNTLDILSEDEEEEPAKVDSKSNTDISTEKQCIAIDDDDDIMLIEEDSNHKEPQSVSNRESVADKAADNDLIEKSNISPDAKVSEKETHIDIIESAPKINEKVESSVNIVEKETKTVEKKEKPLLPEKFLFTAKKNLAEMTRDELEDFCILKIVESIVDRSGLGEIKNKMKAMAQNLEEYRKKAMILTKQNRDLQVVLKSVQEEQKKRTNVIQPLKITRSVGMQVLMTDKLASRRQGLIPSQTPTRPVRAVQNKNTPPVKPNIPFPRLVPANNSSANKTGLNSPAKVVATPNGIRNPSPVQKLPEKRTQSRMQSTSSVTVDLTDDEPPAKIKAKNPVPPVRLVSPQSLMPQQKAQSFTQNNSSPRKVYIPISCPQSQAIRPGQTVVLKTVPATGPPGPRPRGPSLPGIRPQPSPLKLDKVLRHPAPLPDAMKQYTPPTWKPLPPAPDMKLSKVENGIVISWKIDGISENSYETIASYQLYAYQETASSPSTSLWKKIGDVKALPLPMACTLTQFMAGYKYYFAVRAVDIRSRLGPFSVPGSILLLSKV